MQDEPSPENNAPTRTGSVRCERASIARIVRQLAQLDGLALDNLPERRRLARWIAANFVRREP